MRLYDIPNRILITDDYPAPQPMILCGASGFLYKSELCALTGQAKAGKSTCLAYIVSILLGKTTNGNEPHRNDIYSLAPILMVDTEQSPNVIQMAQRLIYDLLGWRKDKENDLLYMIHEKGRSVTEIQEDVECSAEAIRLRNGVYPQLIVLDQIVDMCEDSNDNKASEDTRRWLEKLSVATESCILLVIHLNPDSNKMRGHIGSEIVRKMSDTLEPTIVNGKITLKHTASRYKLMDTDITFNVDTDAEGNKHISNAELVKHTSAQEDLFQMIKDIIDDGGGIPIKQSELIKALIERSADNKSQATMRRKVMTLIRQGRLIVTKGEHNTSWISYTSKTPQEDFGYLKDDDDEDI